VAHLETVVVCKCCGSASAIVLWYLVRALDGSRAARPR